MKRPRVAVVHGENRVENVRRALTLVREDLAPKVKGLVLIKPNFLSCTRQLAATHADAVRAVIEFVTSLSPSKVIVAEGACSGDAAVGYRNFGYLPLAQDFSVPLVDLCQETRWRPIRLLDTEGREVPAEVNALAAEADCRISVAVAKTHDTAVVTLSWKNMMGALRREHRSLMHGYPRGAPRDFSKCVKLIHHNLLRLFAHLGPHIGVVDGFEAMEGEGPGAGTPVASRFAVVSADCVAADAVAARLMGFDPLDIGYLYYAHQQGLGVADLQHIEILGDGIASTARRFQPHSTHEAQRKWR